MSDMVNHPPHYKAGGIEAIDVIEAFKLDFNLGNSVKYILRAGRKGAALEDLRKAAWYLARAIENYKSGGTPDPAYDGIKDFAGSLDVGYEAIRERVKDGGPGWAPNGNGAATSEERRETWTGGAALPPLQYRSND